MITLEDTTVDRLVYAKNPAQALRHVTKDMIALSTADSQMIATMSKTTPIENAMAVDDGQPDLIAP